MWKGMESQLCKQEHALVLQWMYRLYRQSPAAKANLANLGQIAQELQQPHSHPRYNRRELLDQATAMVATDCRGAPVACAAEHVGTLAVHDSWASKPRVSALLESAKVSKFDS